jgi:hypothetical protein
MSLDQKKYKVFTKQIFNSLIDEHPEWRSVSYLNANTIYSELNSDEFLKILTQRISNKDKIKLSLMVSLFSSNDDLDITVNEVLNKLTVFEISEFDNLSDRKEECNSCSGSGWDECSSCYGDGDFECSNCDGSGEVDCPDCDGSGEDGEDTCGNCGGSGKDICRVCDGVGTETCRSCYGDGRYDCSDCDGIGEVNSQDPFWDEHSHQIFTLKNNLKDLKLDHHLSTQQQSELTSQPSISVINLVDSWVPEHYPKAGFKNDYNEDLDNIWVLRDIYTF